MMTPLVIYHADCTDGFGAAFAAWLKLGDNAKYLPMKYGYKTLPMIEGRDVYILDFSFPREDMDYTFRYANKVIWLDHHKTAFEMWCGGIPEEQHFSQMYDAPHPYIVLDNNKSGALLAWEYFHPEAPVPKLIQHIDDRDRWQFKMDGSKELHAALAAMKPWSFKQWAGYEGSEGCFHTHSLIQEGTAILRAQDQHVHDMAKQARGCNINYFVGHPETETHIAHIHFSEAAGLAVNANLHHSELGHELANRSGTYGLIWYFGQDRRVKCSLRSNGDYDVSEIAKAFGGGGHKNAAGFETDINTLMGWMI